MKQKILITCALPYANGALHFGHIAGAYLPGDCYARFQRLKGNEVLFLCGSDEHGVAITISAELAGRTPKQHVDLYHEVIQNFFRQLNMSFDHYSRTTWKGHYETTQEFYDVLMKKGFIEERTENHLYSKKEQRFLADRYVVGTCPKCGFEEARGDECQRCAASYEATDLKNPRSKVTGDQLTQRPSTHLYLRFDKFKEQLREWLDSKRGTWKENVFNFAMSYVENLKPRAITRDSNWGVPVPGYPDKVFYVWFDAPIGYISAAKEWNPKRWEEFWLDPKTKLVQFIGKDNIPFHAVFFPAMLMGQDRHYKLPDEIPANEFYLLEGRQFSKSEGWTIDLDQFYARYTIDQTRYAIAADAPETSDSEFSWKEFQKHCNAELLGKFGNFVHRTMMFAHQQCSGKIPTLHSSVHEDEQDRLFLEKINLLCDFAAQCYDGFHLRKACQTLMELAQTGNSYFDSKKPWAMAKNPEQRTQLETCITCSLYCVKALALIASPLIPESAQKIWQQLGFSSMLEKQNWNEVQKMELTAGQKLGTPEPLFRKMEDAEVTEQVEKLGAKEEIVTKSYEPVKSTISFDHFQTFDLRVALVLEAERVPKAKKLLKLRIDLGFEQRTIISGIAQHYEPDQLVGKKVIVVANLAPANIMGIESQGMLLAAKDGDVLEIASIQHLPPGSSVG